METMGERARKRREELQLKQKDVAAQVPGMTESALSQLESGSTKGVKPQNLLHLARALRMSVEELVEGRARTGKVHNVEEHGPAGARLPLISWVRAGLRDDANDPYAPGKAETWIDFDTAASTSAFCLRVRGDSMVRPDGSEPSFPDGCIIGVEPRRRPKSRDFAVFRFNDSDEATFKQFIVDGPLKILKPLNPSYPNIVLGPDAQLVGTVFEKRIITKY